MSKGSRQTFKQRHSINDRPRRISFWHVIRDIGNRLGLAMKALLVDGGDGGRPYPLGVWKAFLVESVSTWSIRASFGNLSSLRVLVEVVDN